MAYTISEIASLNEATRNKEKAYQMRETCCTILREGLGPASVTYYKALHAQGACYWKFGDYDRGETLGVCVTSLSGVCNARKACHFGR